MSNQVIFQVGNHCMPKWVTELKSFFFFQTLPDIKNSIAANRSRRNIEKQFYGEGEEEDEQDKAEGKTFQVGSFVHIMSMCTKRVT